MSSEPTSLADMRREIDFIDDSMHDLLMRRAGLVDDIRRLKQDDADGFYRPKREAEVLRRLIDRHRGSLPKSVVVRIWREMMGALLCLQGPFAVALWAPPGSADYGRVARDHFGSATPITPYRSARAAISAINEGAASVAVLPYPEKGESDPWWPLLAADGTRRVTVLGRLPFVMPETAGEAEPAALVLGGATPEQTGSDNSVLLIDTAGTLSTMSIAGALTDAGLAPQHFDSRQYPAPHGSTVQIALIGQLIGPLIKPHTVHLSEQPCERYDGPSSGWYNDGRAPFLQKRGL